MRNSDNAEDARAGVIVVLRHRTILSIVTEMFKRVSNRTGLLTLKGMSIKTPAIAIPTHLYAIAHLTRDMWERVLDPERTVFEVYFEDVHENWAAIERAPFSFKRFANLEGWSIWLAFREHRYFVENEIELLNGKDHVSGLSHAGVIKLTMEDMKMMMLKIEPEATISPIDHFRLPGTDKRVKKSIERTCGYYQKLSKDCNSPLIPSYLATHIDQDRESLIAINASSLAISCNYNGPVYVRGEYNLNQMLQWLKEGKLDVIDALQILRLAESGIAIVLPETFVFDELGSIGTINLLDEKYRDDISLLSAGCSCPGCQFMKAYIHHLFVVSEMLGPAALYAHNLHQLTRLVHSIHS